MNKQVFFIILLLLIVQNTTFSFDLDMTVEDDIRKNYNSSKLVKDTHMEPQNEDLPALPDISKYETTENNTSNTTEHAVIENYNNIDKISEIDSEIKGNIKIHAGTSFDVVNATKINDWLARGNNIKFYTKSPIIRRKYVIPANTLFYGNITEVHRPQITCNGGLVVIKINRMVYKGQSISIKAYITRADDKMIFLNNLKGDRTYLKTMWKKGNWGRTLFGRMMTLSVNLGGDGATFLLSPFPFAYGTICLGLNTITSPITAFFSKGGHLSIPVGSDFRIKLIDPIFID